MTNDPKDAAPSKTGDPDPAEYSNTSKAPADWVTGDEPMTGAQASSLKTICEEVGAESTPVSPWPPPRAHRSAEGRGPPLTRPPEPGAARRVVGVKQTSRSPS